MRKNLKMLIQMLSLSLLFLIQTTPVYAETSDNMNEQFGMNSMCPYSISNSVKTYASPRSVYSYVYSPSSISSTPIINKSGEFDNKGGSLPQSKTISFSRSYSFTGTISTSAEAGVIFAKVGVSAEASLGVSKTVNTSTTFNIGAGKYGYYQVGSKRKVTVGKMTAYNLITCTAGTPYNVNVSFTHGLYDKYWEN